MTLWYPDTWICSPIFWFGGGGVAADTAKYRSWGQDHCAGDTEHEKAADTTIYKRHQGPEPDASISRFIWSQESGKTLVWERTPLEVNTNSFSSFSITVSFFSYPLFPMLSASSRPYACSALLGTHTPKPPGDFSIGVGGKYSAHPLNTRKPSVDSEPKEMKNWVAPEVFLVQSRRFGVVQKFI